MVPLGVSGSKELESSAPPAREASSLVVGKIRSLTGAVTVVRADGATVRTDIGSPLSEGDLIETGEGGRVGITFEDGTAFNLSSNARMSLSKFGYDSNGALSSALIRVSQGSFAFIGGKAAMRGGLLIETPFATIRGNARAGAIGTLTLVALTIALLQKLEAASGELVLLDDLIQYKDMEYGALGIVPKGGDAGLIVLDDPELTVVIHPPESGYRVEKIVNSAAVMEILLAVSQEAHVTYLLGQADPLTTGSVQQRAASGLFLFDDVGTTQIASNSGGFLPPLPDEPSAANTSPTSLTSDAPLSLPSEDVAPVIVVAADADPEELSALDLVLDESIGRDPGGNNLLSGTLDDISGNAAPVYSTDPDGFQDASSQAIGRQDTASGVLAVLFTTTVDFGSVGQGTRTDVLKLLLSGTNVTNLYATQTGAAAIAGLVGEELQISLFAVSDTVVEGRIAGNNGNGSDAYVVFRISLVDADNPATARLVVEQFMAIDHGVDDPSLPDEAAPLLLAAGGSLELMQTTTLVTGNGSEVDSSASVTLIGSALDGGAGSFITFEDDGPRPQDYFAEVLESQSVNFRIAFVLDYSGSINNSELNQQLTAVKAAGQAFFESSGDVTITMIAFGSTAANIGTFTDYATFAAAVDSTNPSVGGVRPASGGTDYTAAIQATIASYVPDADYQNQVIFISDGAPTEQLGPGGASLTTATAGAWDDFVNNGSIDIDVQTVGIGDGVNIARLADLEVDGGSPILIGAFADLINTLLDLVDTNDVTGNLIEGSTGSSEDFGTDGGRILSFEIGEVTYVWDGTDSAGAIDPGTPEDSSDDIDGTMLTDLTTPGGGLLSFDFTDGSWTYTAPIEVGIDNIVENFTYTLIDGDLDVDSAILQVTVLPGNDAPTFSLNLQYAAITTGNLDLA